jgi:hypothetical protein
MCAVLAAIGLAAWSCGGDAATGGPALTAAAASNGERVQSFTLSDVSPPRVLDLPDANINDTPIHVWVSMPAPGEIGQIRVTGHANAEVCGKASLDLLALLSDRSNVDGFLGFGVGQLRAAKGATGYAQAASALVLELASLQKAYPEFVQLHPVTIDQSDGVGLPPAGAEQERTAVLRFRSPAAGAAFVPLHSWSPGRAVSPVHFDVSAKELGVNEALMVQLAPNIAAAPWADAVALLRDRLDRLGRLQQFLSAGGSLQDSAESYQVIERSGPVSVDQLEGYNELLTRYERYLDASRFLFDLPTSTKIKQETQAKEVAANRLANERCVRHVRSGTTCWRYFEVTSVLPKTENERVALLALNKGLETFERLNSGTFETLERALEGQLGRARKALTLARDQASDKAKASARETLVDGLLRGWPIPVSDDPKLEHRLEALQEDDAPGAWKTIVGDLTRQGVDISDGVSIAGALNRGNVFFSVHAMGGDRYRVTPTYAVSGPYLEVWDPIRHTVTVESKTEAVILSMLAR